MNAQQARARSEDAATVRRRVEEADRARIDAAIRTAAQVGEVTARVRLEGVNLAERSASLREYLEGHGFRVDVSPPWLHWDVECLQVMAGWQEDIGGGAASATSHGPFPSGSGTAGRVDASTCAAGAAKRSESVQVPQDGHGRTRTVGAN
jgi:hypothetical protein